MRNTDVPAGATSQQKTHATLPSTRQGIAMTEGTARQRMRLVAMAAAGLLLASGCGTADSRSTAGPHCPKGEVAASGRCYTHDPEPASTVKPEPAAAKTPTHTNSAEPSQPAKRTPNSPKPSPTRSPQSRWAYLGPVIGGGTVAEVVDGDTVHVNAGGRDLDVQVLGIDAPETADPRKPVQCWGRMARLWAQHVLDGRYVTLRADSTQDRTDKYGRTLAYLILADRSNYSLRAVASGNAHSYVYDFPVLLHPRLEQAEADAHAARRGLWGPPCYGDTTQVAPGQEPAPRPAPTHKTEPPASSGGNCAPGYTPCLPIVDDLDCADIGHPVRVTGADPYRLDADGDGWGCES